MCQLIDLMVESSLKPKRLEIRLSEAEVEAAVDCSIHQQVMVRKIDDCYELIQGVGVWYTAQAAQIHEISVVIRNISDTGAKRLLEIEYGSRKEALIDEARRIVDIQLAYLKSQAGQAIRY